MALENPHKQVVWMTLHTKQYGIQGLGLNLSTMSEDVTVSFPEGTEGMEVSPGNQHPGLRLRNNRTSETSSGHSVTWVLSHQDILLELEIQAVRERNMNLNMEKVEIGDKKELCFSITL